MPLRHSYVKISGSTVNNLAFQLKTRSPTTQYQETASTHVNRFIREAGFPRVILTLRVSHFVLNGRAGTRIALILSRTVTPGR